MVIDFECPKCGLGVDSGDIPDHVSDAMKSPQHTFDYVCDCGVIFDVLVEYYPSFDVIDDSVRATTKP